MPLWPPPLEPADCSWSGNPATIVRRTGTFGRRGQRQGDLALGVDVIDADLDGLAERQDVFDVVDPLATGQRESSKCATGRRVRAGR